MDAKLTKREFADGLMYVSDPVLHELYDCYTWLSKFRSDDPKADHHWRMKLCYLELAYRAREVAA